MTIFRFPAKVLPVNEGFMSTSCPEYTSFVVLAWIRDTSKTLNGEN
jgi:hypothetical protein